MKKNFVILMSAVAVSVSVILSSCAGAEMAHLSPMDVEEDAVAEVVENVSVKDSLTKSEAIIEQNVNFSEDGVTLDLDPTAYLNIVLSKDTIQVEEGAEINPMMSSTEALRTNVTSGRGDLSTLFVYNDGQQATVNYGWECELFNGQQTPHVQIQNVQYVRAESEQVEEGVYKMTLVFTADVIRYASSNTKTSQVTLRPYYIKVVKAAEDVITGVEYRIDENVAATGLYSLSVIKVTHHSLSADTEETVEYFSVAVLNGEPCDKNLKNLANYNYTVETKRNEYLKDSYSKGHFVDNYTEYENHFYRNFTSANGKTRTMDDCLVTRDHVITYNCAEYGLNQTFNVGVNIVIANHEVVGNQQILTLDVYVKGGKFDGIKVKTMTSTTTMTLAE